MHRLYGIETEYGIAVEGKGDVYVVDSVGRTHDHENLFVVGSPTLPTAGCTNGTLTFAAVTLRSAGTIGNAL